ncbi:hypothetical protein [Paenibacillus agricola]|uniref:Immunity protein 8 of polymorphic toxin system n=1 Tax=Paenibacillus agricola TaxID=2716264 RepID=A0ABX0J062_9BACL|nr:hypothetical protein [Paenibacillus agricola]NHN28816.1 hypothetical protein [Paenibacillus agricola]
MMKFDYCEIEDGSAQTLAIYVGCRFEDEPEELYVIQLHISKNGIVQLLKLLFNGMDCRYSFKDEEKASIKNYIYEMLPATPYEEWLEGSIAL